MCLLFAATYPERTLGLLLWGCFARYDWRLSFIGRYWGGTTVDDALDRLEREWGDGGDLAAMAPSMAGDDAARRAGAARSGCRRRRPRPARCCG